MTHPCDIEDDTERRIERDNQVADRLAENAREDIGDGKALLAEFIGHDVDADPARVMAIAALAIRAHLRPHTPARKAELAAACEALIADIVDAQVVSASHIERDSALAQLIEEELTQ